MKSFSVFDWYGRPFWDWKLFRAELELIITFPIMRWNDEHDDKYTSLLRWFHLMLLKALNQMRNNIDKDLIHKCLIYFNIQTNCLCRGCRRDMERVKKERNMNNLLLSLKISWDFRKRSFDISSSSSISVMAIEYLIKAFSNR